MNDYTGFFSLLSNLTEICEAYLLESQRILSDNELAKREKAYALESLTDSFKEASR